MVKVAALLVQWSYIVAPGSARRGLLVIDRRTSVHSHVNEFVPLPAFGAVTAVQSRLSTTCYVTHYRYRHSWTT